MIPWYLKKSSRKSPPWSQSFSQDPRGWPRKKQGLCPFGPGYLEGSISSLTIGKGPGVARKPHSNTHMGNPD